MALLTQSDLVFQGSFKVPKGAQTGDTSFAYSGHAIAYNAANDSLFFAGHDHHQKIAEISIPAIVNSTTLSALNTATVLQTFVEPTEGGMASIGSGTKKIGGLLVNGGKLLVTGYIYYDASGTATLSHFRRPLNLSTTGQVEGPYQLQDASDTALKAGYFGGYLCDVPAAYQAGVGAPVLTGQCNIPIITRTSRGPGAFGFDPADLGVETPVPALPMVYYTGSHSTLGEWDQAGLYFNISSQIYGLVFPAGFDSVLFFGRMGTTYCYGTGEACGDPSDAAKGAHGYPYLYQIWHYNINDLLAATNPWDVIPEIWNFTLPFTHSSRLLGGAAYDAANQRIYLVAYKAESGGYPMVHVFDVEGTPAEPPDPAILTRSLATVHAGQTNTVTWADIAEPSETDWVGLFAQGALSSNPLDWFYLNQSKTAPDDPIGADGNFAFTIPGKARSGTYEFRLFAQAENDDGLGNVTVTNSLMATSDTFTVKGRKLK